MILLTGAVMLAGTIALLVWLRARDGQETKLASMPVIGPALPLVITGGLALGAAMIVGGLLN